MTTTAETIPFLLERGLPFLQWEREHKALWHLSPHLQLTKALKNYCSSLRIPSLAGALAILAVGFWLLWLKKVTFPSTHIYIPSLDPLLSV